MSTSTPNTSNVGKKVRGNPKLKPSNTLSASNAGTKNADPKRTTNVPSNSAQQNPVTPPKFHFELDKMSKDQVLLAIERAQHEDEDQQLIEIQSSQSETKIEERKLAESPIVKAFNEAERKKLSKSK